MRQRQLPVQLGFDDLLAAADQTNRELQFRRDTAHLPGTMEDALPFFRSLVERHHSAMLAADVKQVFERREEANILAARLNGSTFGILANDDAPGCALERLSAAPPGEVPLWGQAGKFVVEAAGTRVLINMSGVFGLCSGTVFWPGFKADCVDVAKPFISETGYRSFLGINAKPTLGLKPDDLPAPSSRRTLKVSARGSSSRSKRSISKPARNEPEVGPGT